MRAIQFKKLWVQGCGVCDPIGEGIRIVVQRCAHNQENFGFGGAQKQQITDSGFLERTV